MNLRLSETASDLYHRLDRPCRWPSLAGWYGVLIAGGLSLLLGCPTLAHAALPRLLSVQELNEQAARLSGRPLRVEGRVLLFGRDNLRFKNCRIPFRSKEALPRFPRKVTNVEVTGRLQRVGDELEFQVERMTEQSSDISTYHERRRQLDGKTPERWYALGMWASQRGQFYKDHELLALGEEASLRGIDLERRQTPPDRVALLTRLAARAKSMNLPSALQYSLIHEAYRLRIDALDKATVEQRRALAKDIDRDLPAAKTPLEPNDLPLTSRYAEKPLDVYEAADPAARRKIHRLMYTAALLPALTGELAADSSNGFDVAEQVDQQFPEQHKLAEQYRDQALAHRAGEVDKLTRREVLNLAEQYRDRKQPQQADRILESWLTLRRRRLDKNDVEGLLQVADDYRKLLRRNEISDRLLLESAERNPTSAEVAERLERAGYRLRDGVWLSAEDFDTRTESRLERALREGRVEPGMTGTQVRKGLGSPLSIARSATSGQICETWLYGQAETSRLAVLLVKRRSQLDLQVVEVRQVP